MNRSDYAFPFALDGGSRSGARAPSYEAHVAQMVRQVLLTAPGERVNLPSFGCGLRRLLFAPNSQALGPTAKVLVSQALNTWLGNHIEVKSVDVVAAEPPNEERLLIRVEYVLLETRSTQRVEVLNP